jgi:hypothetical protein
MITLTREEAQQVLDAMSFCAPMGYGPVELYQDSIKLLRAKLSALEPEPVAYLLRKEFGFGYEQADRADYGAFPVYTAPPQREWQSLTDGERDALLRQSDWQYDPESYGQLIEAKLREKNGNL